MTEDILDNAKNSAVQTIIDSATKNIDIKDSGNELAKTIHTVTQFINIALLPIAAVNFGYNKAKAYFEKDFQKDMQEKLSKVPSENIIEPKASIAGPVMQALSFSHEEQTLKDLYLELLSTSMNSEVADKAHPSFVEIIKQLSGEDAKFFAALARIKEHPIARLSYMRDKFQYTIIQNHLLDYKKLEIDNQILKNYYIILDNLERLKLVSIDYEVFLSDESEYSYVKLSDEFLHHSANIGNNSLKFKKGVLEISQFGIIFAEAVGLIGHQRYETNNSKDLT